MVHPYQQVWAQDVDALAAGADGDTVVGVAKGAITILSAEYIAAANITGAAVERRTLTLINKGLDGNGATVVATLDFLNTVNALDYDSKAFTLSAVAGALNMADGEVLDLRSLHIGATGLADPGGTVRVVYGPQGAAS